MTEPHRHGADPDVAALVRAASGGDESAWRTLVDRYWRRIFALARSRGMGTELAEEITQSVFATLAAKLGAGQYEEQGLFEPWLFRIAMNRVRDAARTRRPAPLQMPDGALERRPDAADCPNFDAEDLLALREAIGRLDETDRDVIALRHHAQLPFNAIAESLGQPLGTVLARHHRALAKLRDMMSSPSPSAAPNTADKAAGS